MKFREPAKFRELTIALAVLGLVLFGGVFPVSGQGGWRLSALPEAGGADLNTVFFLDSKRGWIGGDDGLVISTKDAGLKWNSQTIASKSGINDIYFRDKENGFLLSSNTIYQSRDGGESWRPAQVFDQSKFGGMPELYSIRFTGKNKGWVVGSVSKGDAVVDSLILHTEDGGTSWTRLASPSRQELIHVDFVSDSRGWIVGAGGTILYTADEGESWTSLHSGTTSALYHVDFRNEDRGWAVGEKGTVVRTTDGGDTWTTVPLPVKSTLLSVQFIDDKRGWLVGRSGVVMRSEDGGVSWVNQVSGSSQNLYALFVENKNAWVVGGNGVLLQFPR